MESSSSSPPLEGGEEGKDLAAVSFQDKGTEPQEKDLLSVPSTEERQSSIEAITTPSISMSAGPDPWAESVPVTIMASSQKSSAADNVWATSNTPDLVYEGSKFQSSGSDANSSQVKSKQSMSAEAGETIGSGTTVATIQEEDGWEEYRSPKLGHAVAHYFCFKPGFLQLNSGETGLKRALDAAVILICLFCSI
jgi:hypothetical protein